MIEFSTLLILNPLHWQLGLRAANIEEGMGDAPKAKAWILWFGPIGFQVTLYFTC